MSAYETDLYLHFCTCLVTKLCCHSQWLLDSVEMYAFYSLLVYIFYTVFKKEEEEEALEGAYGASSDVCLATLCPASGLLWWQNNFLRGTYMSHPPSETHTIEALVSVQDAVLSVFYILSACLCPESKDILPVHYLTLVMLPCLGARTCSHGNREQEKR